ncbi:STAS-like domain-containing protein [Clostridium polynesiense]|uniref:STAS-like domain-containing protein n=1 Tax=Clostridium polynesiense TaxID=1325933 RepID=UPI00058F1584|nr:STAS-like domain-containing protein [Clostridium polynesiense]
MLNVKVKDFLGESFAVEDAILLRGFILDNIGQDIQLDFSDIDKVPTTFLCCLFSELINTQGRDYIFRHINVKNLSNINNYNRVVLGTSFTN